MVLAAETKMRMRRKVLLKNVKMAVRASLLRKEIFRLLARSESVGGFVLEDT